MIDRLKQALNMSDTSRDVMSVSQPRIASRARNLGRAIGQVAKNKKRDELAIAKGVQEAISKAARESGALDDLVRQMDGYAGVYQLLSRAVEDPAFGIDPENVKALKQQVMNLMQQALPDNDSRSFIQRTLATLVDTATPEAFNRFKQYQHEYSRIAGQIEPPSTPVPQSGVALNPIGMQELNRYSNQVRMQAKAVMDIVGDSHDVRFVSYKEFGGKSSIVAQIFSRGQNERWLSNVPIQFGTDERNTRYFRSGESFNTLYAAPKGGLDAQVAYSQFKRAGGRKGFSAQNSSRGLRRAFRSIENLAISELRSFYKNGRLDNTGYNAKLASHMESVERLAASQHPMAEHIRIQAGLKVNQLSMFNLQGIPQNDLMQMSAAIAASPGFDAGGAKGMMSGHGADTTVKIKLMAGSPFERIAKTYGLSRADLPVTAREGQIFGRTARYMTPSKKIGLGIGQMQGGVSSSSFWGDMTSGGLGRAMVIDFNPEGQLSRALGDSGQAYSGTSELVRKPVNFTILDPESHAYGQSPLLKRLLSSPNGIHLTREEIQSGLYLGETPAGKSKIIPFDPGAQGMFLQLDRTASAAGKKMIHVSGTQDTISNSGKVFGSMTKGNVENIGRNVRRFFRGKIEEDFDRLGIHPEDAIFSASDFFKKSRMSMIHQIAQSVKMTGGPHEAALRASAEALNPAEVASYFGEDSILGRYSIAATRAMRGLHHSDLGSALAGVYYGPEGKGGLSKAGLERLASEHSNPQGVIKAMKRGLAITYDVFQRGEGEADWGRGRAGIEARIAKGLHERLMSSGMPLQQASNITADLFKSKIGLQSHFELSRELTNMVSSLSGKALETRGTTLGFNQLAEMEVGNSGLSGWLKKQEGGARFNSDQLSPKARLAFNEVFKQGEVYLPGAEAFRASVGTEIKQAGGMSRAIDNEYGQLINDFSSRLVGLGGQSHEDAVESLTAWREKATNLFSDVHSELFRGKLKGGASPRNLRMNLTYGPEESGLSGKAYNAAVDLWNKTSGQFMTLNAQGFASQLEDLRGVEPDAYLAAQARRFFTTMETGQRSGIMGITARHPAMSSGNVFITQTFRNLNEVTALGGEDEYFMNMKRSPQGLELLRRHGFEEARSFMEIAKSEHVKQKVFFRDFIQQLRHFTGDGGAIAHLPSVFAISNGMKVDLGQGANAFADADGDTLFHVMASQSSAKAFLGMDRTHDLGFRTVVQEYSEYIGQGINNMAKSGRFGAMPTGMDAVAEDVLKEIGLDQTTGRVDVRLRALHDALLEYSPDLGDSSHGRGLLGALQEKFVLKSKKLPLYTNVSEQLASAVDQLMIHGNADSLDNILRYSAFEGTDYATGARIGSHPIEALPGGNSGLLNIVGEQRRGSTLDELMNLFKNVSTLARANGTDYGTTSSAWSKRLRNASSESLALSQLLTGKDMASAASREYAGGGQLETAAAVTTSAIDTIKRNLSTMDARLAGPAMMGLMGGTMALSLLGNQGYSAEALSPAGESAPQRVTDQIENGRLFTPQDTQVLDQSVTYVERPNAFQLRGETTNMSSLEQISASLAEMTNGPSSVLVNDLRRPISRSYVDRLSGEY